MHDIELFLAINKLKQKNLADFLGVGQPRISQYIKEKHIPYDKLIMILKNKNGWDVSMLDKSELLENYLNDETEDNCNNSSKYIDILKSIIEDYQTRLTNKDEAIVKLVSSVISQNEKLNYTLEKVFEKVYNN